MVGKEFRILGKCWGTVVLAFSSGGQYVVAGRIINPFSVKGSHDGAVA
jgi:hypothetical protein